MTNQAIARKVQIVAVEGECLCGGPLVAENGSFSLSVHETGIKCQDCGKAHRLPLWITSKNSKQLTA